MANVDIRVGKKDAVFFSANPTLILKDGQFLFNSDTLELFIGDGTTQLSTLTAINGGSGVQSVTGLNVDDTDPFNPIVNPLGLIQIVDKDGDFFTDLATATAYIEQYFNPSIITDKSFNNGVFYFTVPSSTSTENVVVGFLSAADGISTNSASFVDEFGLVNFFLSASNFERNSGYHIMGNVDFQLGDFNEFSGIAQIKSIIGISAALNYFGLNSTGKFIIEGNLGSTETANFGATFFSGSTATIFANASKYTSNAGGIQGDLAQAITNGCNVFFDGIDKAPIASPTFTGTPLAPTAPAGTNNTQIATTAYADAKGAHQGFYTGKWKTIPFASAPTGLNGWVGGIIYVPIPIGETQKFTRIGEEVTTGIAAQNIRLALYRSVNGLPATLIEDSGNLSAVTNGLKYFPFTSPVTVNAIEKQVFAAIQVSNNSIGLRVANSVCLNYFNGSGLTGSLFSQSQAFGPFPANATPVAYNNVISPLVSLLMQ